MHIKNKPRIGIFWLPSVITCCSLVSGIYAMILAIQGNFIGGCILLSISSVLDVLDGLVAKMTNSASAFGEQLDSMSDMVVFGVAPALMAWLWSVDVLGNSMTVVSGLFIVMAALRLARFNVQLQDKKKKPYFQGLPTPAAAIWVFSLIWLSEELVLNGFYASWALAVACVVGGVLMVSNVRYLGTKHLMEKRITFIGLSALVLILFLIVSQPAVLFFLLALSYVLSGIFYTMVLRRQRRIQKKIRQSITPLNQS